MLKMLSSEFFLPTKNFRYLSVLLAVHHNADISQHGIAQEVGMSSAMVNGYIKAMKDNAHIDVIDKNGRDKRYQLTESGKKVLMQHLMSCSAEIVHLYSKAKAEIVSKLKALGNGAPRIRVLLFGGSETAQMVVSALEQIEKYKVVAIVDNDSWLWGHRIGAHIIQSPEILKTIKVDSVIISTFARQNEIYRDIQWLEKKGVDVVRLSTL